MAFPYFPPEDLHTNFCRALRAVMIDLTNFRKAETGFTLTPTATDNRLSFPFVGIDFRTLTVTGNTNPYTIEVNTPRGLDSDLIFSGLEPAPITIGDYSRWTTYFVGDYNDLQFDIFSYFGDTEFLNKHTMHIPICVPFIESVSPSWQSGQGESAYVSGSIVVLGNSTCGMRTLKAETAKIFHAVRQNGTAFTAKGIKAMRLHPPQYDVYTDNGGLYESVTPFTALVRFAPEGVITSPPSAGNTSSSNFIGSTFIWEQVTPAMDWNINHNLGSFPTVVVTDHFGVTYYPAISYTDQNNVVVHCGSNFSGYAYLNR